jgi:diadenosine tetraphosphate (Ap4A) HIT family hydrolase
MAKDLKKFREENGGDNRWIGENDHFFVILDLYPKVTGHTLIISKRDANDITDLNEEESRSLGRILVKTTKQLKESLKVDKVYVMTMCEHWEPNEISPTREKGQELQSTTEHFHFQLLPRYKEMRTKENAQENLFTRPQDYGCTPDMLTLVRNRITALSS